MGNNITNMRRLVGTASLLALLGAATACGEGAAPAQDLGGFEGRDTPARIYPPTDLPPATSADSAERRGSFTSPPCAIAWRPECMADPSHRTLPRDQERRSGLDMSRLHKP